MKNKNPNIKSESTPYGKKLIAQKIVDDFQAEIKTLTDTFQESVEALGFRLEGDLNADFKVMGKDEDEDEDKGTQAPTGDLVPNYAGEFLDNNPKDEFFSEIDFLFFPEEYGKDYKEALDEGDAQWAGDIKGRKPGFTGGTLTDIGVALLTARAVMKGIIEFENVDPFHVAVHLVRDNGEKWKAIGTFDEVLDAINLAMKEESLGGIFEFCECNG